MQSKLRRVLYVEDDPIIYPLAIMALEDFGTFEVKHCISGPEALENAEDFEPEIMLIDVMMPGMDGVETLAKLRERVALRNVPVVFMTAKAQAHEQQVYLDAGAEAVISKPFDPLTLADEIRGIWRASITERDAA